MRIIATLILVSTGFCLAQGSGDFRPPTSNVLDAQYPRVDDKSRVEMRFKAPDASKVGVTMSAPAKLLRADGVQSAQVNTTGPRAHRG